MDIVAGLENDICVSVSFDKTLNCMQDFRRLTRTDSISTSPNFQRANDALTLEDTRTYVFLLKIFGFLYYLDFIDSGLR